mmetsp:Transcript_111390/g.314501  ORF Transcript_111390/g.314501 Transcript_111390/m.314501 type:complete len:270 (+) Transcript_111390:832-1641(+)
MWRLPCPNTACPFLRPCRARLSNTAVSRTKRCLHATAVAAAAFKLNSTACSGRREHNAASNDASGSEAGTRARASASIDSIKSLGLSSSPTRFSMAAAVMLCMSATSRVSPWTAPSNVTKLCAGSRSSSFWRAMQTSARSCCNFAKEEFIRAKAPRASPSDCKGAGGSRATACLARAAAHAEDIASSRTPSVATACSAVAKSSAEKRTASATKRRFATFNNFGSDNKTRTCEYKMDDNCAGPTSMRRASLSSRRVVKPKSRWSRLRNCA